MRVSPRLFLFLLMLNSVAAGLNFVLAFWIGHPLVPSLVAGASSLAVATTLTCVWTVQE